jgi:hypothetical protein
MAEARIPNGSYPEGEILKGRIVRRHRIGTTVRVLFQVALIVGVVALIALLYTIINDSFGLIAIEYERDPDRLALEYTESRLLALENTLSSEDDEELVQGVAGDPYAIGFFGYAYYQQHRDALKTVGIGGQVPSLEAAESGAYPLSRPLFLYTAENILAEKPQVSAFINYYLNHASQVIGEVGYFPLSEEALNASREAWLAANGQEGQAFPSLDPVAGDLAISGSSTVFPLTERILSDYTAAGYQGQASLENVGTTARRLAPTLRGGGGRYRQRQPADQPGRVRCLRRKRAPASRVPRRDRFPGAGRQQRQRLSHRRDAGRARGDLLDRRNLVGGEPQLARRAYPALCSRRGERHARFLRRERVSALAWGATH